MANINVSTEEKRKSTTTNVLNQLSNKIDQLDMKTARSLLFWLNDWALDILPNEKKFDYHSLIRYERGMIVESNFGFKVGSEQGGLHYALIIENDNSKTNRTITVIPLGSLPDDKNPSEIDDYEVFLGYGIFKDEIKKLKAEVKSLEKELKGLPLEDPNREAKKKKLDKSTKKLNKFSKGTVALVNQICAMSKMRIKTPKRSGDELFTFKLSNTKLKQIDRVIKKMYMTKLKSKNVNSKKQKELTTV